MGSNERPLAHATYTCTVDGCGTEQKFYELYFVSSAKAHLKYCSKCRALTLHTKVLPSDDASVHYRRPEGSIPSTS
jgi:hypothetical protein